MEDITAVVLAAGKGTRMKGQRHKLVYPVMGKPIITILLERLKSMGLQKTIVVLGQDHAAVLKLLESTDVGVCIQKNQKGTGDAFASAAICLKGVKAPQYMEAEILQGEPFETSYAMAFLGDTPALDPALITDFIKGLKNSGQPLGVIGVEYPDPTGYGRFILDDQGYLSDVIEQKDASEEQLKITLCNSGIILGETQFFFELLSELDSNNSQGEYYLTACFAKACLKGRPAFVYKTDHWRTFSGVNDRLQLASLETWMISQKIESLMENGVSIRLPATCYIEDDVTIGIDSSIGSCASLEGKTSIGKNCRIGSHVTLLNTVVGDNVDIGDNSVLKGATFADGSNVPPVTVQLD